jgi:hypothetical protein
MNKKLTIAAATVAFVCGTTQAALLAYEGFDYAASTTNDQVEGLSGGTGFSGDWVNSQPIAGDALFAIVEGGDSWGALSVSGNRLLRTGAGGKEYLARTLSADLDATPELWFSVLCRPSSNEGFAIAGSALKEDGSIPDVTEDGNAGFGFVNTDNAGVIAAVWDNTGNRINGTSVAIDGAGVLTFIVGKIAFNSGALGEDIVSIYSVGTDLALPGTFATVQADLDETVFDMVTMESNRAPGYDEIRVGTSFSDVVVIPEPATLGMLVAAGGGLMFIRRKFMIG